MLIFTAKNYQVAENDMSKILYINREEKLRLLDSAHSDK